MEQLTTIVIEKQREYGRTMKFKQWMQLPKNLEPKTRDYAIDYLGAIEQDDGSWVYDNGLKVWYNDGGYVHRDDGPAVINPDGVLRWFDRSRERPFNEWCELQEKNDADMMMLRLQYG